MEYSDKRIATFIGINTTNKNVKMIENLIQHYKEIKREHGHNDEIFKYEAVQHFQENWDVNVSDFSGMLKNALSKQINLIYNLAHGTILHLARKKPEEIRELFKYLFDENIEVMERIKTFDSETDKLFKTIEPTSNGFQDERTVSIYLTFKYPEKYTFFKDSFYTKFCQFLGEKKARKGKKYGHYLSLIQNFKEKYVLNDDELWQLTNATLPENAWPDKEHNILAQDILFVCFDHYPEPNYWVFQGNPKVFNFKTALEQNLVEDWTVSAHKDKIKIGDKVILWITGINPGCYALAEITKEPYKKRPAKDDLFWNTEDKNELKAGLKIIHNLVNNPVNKGQIKEIEELSELKIGNQGTNFAATKEQYDSILKLISNSTAQVSEEEYKFIELIRKIDNKEAVGFHFARLDELINHFNLEESDKRIVFSTPKGKNILPFTISHRYVLATNGEGFELIIPANQKRKVKRLKNYVDTSYFDKLTGETDPPLWTRFSFKNEIDEFLEKLWFDSTSVELNRSVNSNFIRYDNPAYRKAAFDKIYREKIFQIAFSNKVVKIDNQQSEENMNKITIPQNLILYGPPGTGKTYRLTNDYVHLFTDISDEKTKELFSYELVSELKWWEVIAICMYDLEKGKVNDLAEHPLMIEKISQSENSKPRNTIWYWLQNHTKQDCPNVNVAKRHDVQIFWKDENSTWSIDKKLTDEMLPDLIEKLLSWKNYKPENKETKRYEMITFHQSYGYEEFIEGIRPDFQEEEDLKYNIEQGIFIRIAEKARKDKDNPYAIFIDEINRGNISKIFGELITLIEPDKRQGKENELEVTLPYSKTKFSVPPNLYIIGTMNTADRSIALIDTALRRRFHFKEMMPDSKLLDDNIEGINMQFLLDKINERIEFLLDRDHTIGHSYLMKVKSKNDICRVFKNKIIPLLQEYFYNDWEKIQLVLGDNKSWGKNKEEKLVQLKKYYSVEEEKKLFGYDIEEYEDEKIYEINSALKDNRFDEIVVESFIHIYQKPIKIVQT